MPKNKAQRRIDKTAGSGARTVSVVGGGSSGGGSATIEQHALSGSKHTGTLAESQAPWAVTDTEFSAHTSNANAHHNRQHSLLSTSDHTLTAGAYSIVGAVLDNTIGTLSIASSGDGIDVTKSGGQFTVAVDVSDFAGNGLGDDGSNNLYVKVSEGIEIVSDALRVDEDYAFAWANDHTHTSTVGSASFTTGFGGSGWRIDTDAASLELNDLTVRGQLSVYELLVRQIRATNGNVFVTDSAKIDSVSGSGPYTLSVATDDVHGFAVGDLIRAQRFTGTGTYQSNMQVTSVTDTKTFVATLTSGSAPAAGMEFVRLGSTSDSDRRGSIYLAASDNDAPFIDIIDGVDSFGDWNTSAVLKARFGNLAGVTDADFGALSGYGVYVKGGGYFKGDVVNAGGEFASTADGVQIQAYDTNSGIPTANKLTFTTAPMSPTTENVVSDIYGVKTGTTNYSYWRTHAGSGTNADAARVLIDAYNTNAVNVTRLTLNAGTTNSAILQSTDASNLTFFTLKPSVIEIGGTAPILRPAADSTGTLGDATHWYSAIYVDTIYSNSVIGANPDDHHHDSDYVSPAALATALADYSLTTHTHAGYAAASHTHDDRYYTETEIDVTLAGYYTSAEIDTTLANYSLVGHTHDSRYYTESETDALLATKAASSHTHDDRYYTESEVDSLIAALPTSGHTHDDRYYTESEADALLATKASTSHTHDSLTSAGAITLTHDTSSYVNLVDGSGTYARINATGIQSVIPAFSSGVDRSGIDITWAGDINARDITAVNLSTFTFERHQVAAVGTTLAVNSAGKLANEFALTTTGTTHTFDIADPEAGAEQVFQVGDVVRISGMAYANVPTNSETGTPSRALTLPFLPLATVDRNQVLATAYLTIAAADTDYDGYTRYTATYNSGPEYVAFLPGTGAVRWSGGMIVLTSDGDDYAPYIDVFDAGTTPWASGTDAKYVRLGRLDGLGVVASEQYGIALGSDLDDSSAPRFVAGSAGISAYKLDYTANDGTADTVSIAATGRVKFGTDVSSAGTTAFDFNPATDSLTISAAVTLEDDSAIGGDLTMQYGAQIRSVDLDQNPGTYSWWMNPQGLRFDASVGGLEVGGTVADFAAGSGTHTPRIEFYDALASRPRASLRTITNPGASTYSPGDDIITTDLVAITDPTRSDDIGVRLTVASDYGAAASAYVGVFSRYGGFDNEVAMYGDIVRIGALGGLEVSTDTRFSSGFLWQGESDGGGVGQSYFVLSNLPTTDEGLPDGALWNDAGTLKIA